MIPAPGDLRSHGDIGGAGYPPSRGGVEGHLVRAATHAIEGWRYDRTAHGAHARSAILEYFPRLPRGDLEGILRGYFIAFLSGTLEKTLKESYRGKLQMPANPWSDKIRWVVRTRARRRYDGLHFAYICGKETREYSS